MRLLVKNEVNVALNPVQNTHVDKARSFASGHFHQDGAALRQLSAAVPSHCRRYSEEGTSAPPSRSWTKHLHRRQAHHPPFRTPK